MTFPEGVTAGGGWEGGSEKFVGEGRLFQPGLEAVLLALAWWEMVVDRGGGVTGCAEGCREGVSLLLGAQSGTGRPSQGCDLVGLIVAKGTGLLRPPVFKCVLVEMRCFRRGGHMPLNGPF